MELNREEGSDAEKLRRKAEEIAGGQYRLEDISPENIREIIHELHVHQIELKMQNEALRQAQAELEESRTRYADLYDFAPVGYFTLDRNGKIVEANLTGARDLGLAREFILNKPFRLKVAPADRDKFSHHLQAVFNTGERRVCELRLLRKDGSDFFARLESIIVSDIKWNRVCRTSVSDVTDIKRAEEELRESEVKYAAVVEQARDGIFIMQDGMIGFANSAFGRVFGYEVDELIGASFFNLIAPECRERVKDIYFTVLAGEEAPAVYEGRGLCKDGTVRNIEISGGLVQYGGKPAVMGIVRDITERKLTEQELLKTQKLESIGLLAGGIAHDFNNLLTGILGNINLAKLYARPGDKIFSKLVDVERSALQAKDLTQQLFTFSKGGAPVKKVMDIGRVVKDAAGFATRGSKSQCRFIVPDDLWFAEVDQGQINQVINNLIINADQAMPEGGIIEVRVENCSIDSGAITGLAGGDYVKISIRDKGIGIPEAFLPRIFDPYFTTKQKGSGLGLATAYSIVKNHGGHIGIESEMGKGTTVYVYLPATRKEAQAAEDTHMKREEGRTEADEEIPAGKGRILIMDDEELVRKVAGEMLEFIGYEVDCAEEGREAIEIYRKAKEVGEPYDVVLMDLTIPGGMGGKEAVKELVKIDPDVKVIVSSGYANDAIMSDFRRYGFKGVIAKPYNLEELAEVLGKAMKE